MSATFVQDGDSIDYTPGTAVSAGDVIVIGDTVAVAKKDIAANTKGSVTVAGVFAFVKAATSSSAIADGVNCYWDAENEIPTTTAGSNKLIGKSVGAADADDTTVDINLNQ